MDQRDKQNLAVAAVAFLLIVAGIWLMNTMHRNSLVEECLMARRRNCDALLER